MGAADFSLADSHTVFYGRPPNGVMQTSDELSDTSVILVLVSQAQHCPLVVLQKSDGLSTVRLNSMAEYVLCAP